MTVETRQKRSASGLDIEASVVQLDSCGGEVTTIDTARNGVLETVRDEWFRGYLPGDVDRRVHRSLQERRQRCASDRCRAHGVDHLLPELSQLHLGCE